MNILFIANSTGCYGANNSLLDMAKALMNKGINVTVMIPGHGEIVRELLKYNIYYYIIPYECCASENITCDIKYKKLFENVTLLNDAAKIVKERNIDLIHTNASNVDFGAMLATKCNLPHVWHVRELLYDDYKLKYDFPFMQRILFKKANSIISISDYVAKKRNCGKKSVTIYNGIDIQKYAIQKDILLDEESVNVLYCGQIREEKGAMDAILAIQNLVENGYYNYILNIVGEENEYSRNLENYVKRNNIDKWVCFHGHQSNVMNFRKRNNIAVMCSRSEALGRVTIESMLGECFVIGANCGATVELVQDGETGYLYEAGNIKQLVEKLLLVYSDKEKSRAIIRNAKKFALQHFDARNYADKILEIYSQIL